MSERKHFIDWVRVLAFFLLIFFHCAMPFVTFGWEIKNTEHSIGLTRLILWLHQWRLPLLFFVSGVGIHFSLHKRSVIYFAGERVVRLLIPLLFAMFFTIPLQVYFERLQEGKITGSYANFYPTVWEMVPYPQGTLTWSHMWFVVYLFVFCMLLLPVFGLFKIKLFEQFKAFMAGKLSHPLMAGSLFIPLAVIYYLLYIPYPEQGSLVDDWFVFIFSITLLFYGYFLAGSDRFWDTCEKFRFHFIAIAAICAILLFYSDWCELSRHRQKDNSIYMYGTLSALHIWMLVLSILGFAKKHLNDSNAFLQYCNQAVYPFYILHQTLIVAFGYYVVQWPIPILLKLIVLVIGCFASLLLLYHFIIKRFLITRILYGLKVNQKSKK